MRRNPPSAFGMRPMGDMTREGSPVSEMFRKGPRTLPSLTSFSIFARAAWGLDVAEARL